MAARTTGASVSKPTKLRNGERRAEASRIQSLACSGTRGCRRSRDQQKKARDDGKHETGSRRKAAAPASLLAQCFHICKLHYARWGLVLSLPEEGELAALTVDIYTWREFTFEILTFNST